MALNTASPYSNERPGTLETVVSGMPRLDGESIWMIMARDAFETSEDWLDAALRRDLERNIAHHQGRHAPGSKYFSRQFQHRSKGFRPKTRTVVRKNEAMAAQAFFGTRDIVDIRAENESSIVERVSAEINSQLMQYRFDNTLPWFQTLIGAYQDAMVTGVAISHQYWRYEEEISMVPLYNPETGEEILDENGEPAMEEQLTIVHDTPWVELRPVENVRFAPAANWIDPLAASPFIIDRLPMTIGDVMKMVKQKGKSKIPWVEDVDVGILQQGRTDEYSDDSVRRQRERRQLDPIDENSYLNQEFDTIWIHRNIMNYKGQDWIYYSVGVYFLLSEPIPLSEEYPHLKPGERPYTMGFATLETHKNYPQSLVGIVSGLQQNANELSNQRQDNVSLVLNRRYYVKRGQGVDLKALQRNVPGGVVLMNNIDQDIRSDAPPDVTSSSYQEQDRINLDFDDVAGNFSSSTIDSNRTRTDTVGGMQILAGAADIITEYQLRIFTETWVEPVIKQIIRLEQRHETDEAILAMIGEKLELWQRFGISEIQDKMIQGNMTVQVNVGFGATDPTQRINRLATALGAITTFAPEAAARINSAEVAKEVFAAIGFKNGDRFLIPETPEAEQPQEPPDPQIMLEQLRQQGQIALEDKKFEHAQYIENLNTQNDIRKEDIDLQKDMSQKALEIDKFERELGVKLRESEAKERMTFEQAKAKLADSAIRERGQNRRFNEEMVVKRQMGTGI